MKKKIVSYSDILSAIVFIPDSSVLIISVFRLIMMKFFRILGKIAILFLF
ncbi:MAG: hypothetical protein U0W24_03690 [Bacteroidales bacterium]